MGDMDLRFPDCWVNIVEAERYAQTVYPDGATVPARPQEGASARRLAEDLGYGWHDDPTWAMTREHDALHTWLAHKLGLEHSPTLWAVAHDRKTPRGLIPGEEAMVLAFQRWMNDPQGADLTPLWHLTARGHSLVHLRLEALVLLRGAAS